MRRTPTFTGGEFMRVRIGNVVQEGYSINLLGVTGGEYGTNMFFEATKNSHGVTDASNLNLCMIGPGTLLFNAN